MRGLLFAGLAALTFSAIAAAQGTAVKVNERKAYKHKPSGFEVATSAAGLTRQGIVTYHPEQLEVRIAFASPDGAEHTDIYLFRRVIGDAALWFDRATSTVPINPRLGTVIAEERGVTVFTPAGAAAGSGLVTAFSASGEFRSTALAMTANDEWLVKVRSSSRTLDSAAVRERAIASLSAIRWGRSAPGTAVAPVADCPSPLASFKEAALTGDQAQAAMLGGVFGLTKGKWDPALRYCAERRSTMSSLYRRTGTTDSYVLAVGDNGVAAAAGPAPLAGLAGKDGKVPMTYSVALYQADRKTGFGDFGSLPPPAQVERLLESGRYTYSVKTWGEGMNITLARELLNKGAKP